MIKFILALTSFPVLAFAAKTPSMTSLWLELGFMLAMLIIVKISPFSNQRKAILFAVYILSDIITQTLWIPILLFIGLYIMFKKNSDEF